MSWLSKGVCGGILVALVLPPWVVRPETAVGDEAARASDGPAADHPQAQQGRIDRLIEQLGAPDYHVRQKAQAELSALGFEAFDALSEAETHEDLEIATRAKYLLRLMRIQWSTDVDSPEVRDILQDYEFQDSENRLLRMRRLAALSDDAGVPALCRLVRFEKSSLLSKRAAIEILGRYDPEKPLPESVAATIEKHLGSSRRVAADWLRTTLKFRNDPEAAVEYWGKLVESEKEKFRAAPDQSQPQIISALIRLQINWLNKLDRQEEAVDAMRELIAWEEGDSETLAELVQWLVEQEAWKAVDEVASRYAERFDRDPNLRYMLAQGYLAQGKKELAEKTAKEAFELLPGDRPERLVAHLITAYGLRERGMFPWAKREYRYVLENSSAGHSYTMTAYYGLSEMLHDQAEDLEAAEVLEEALESAQKHRPRQREYDGRSPEQIRARALFFRSRHWRDQGDLQKQREFLDKALEADPHDIDVLIDCYRVDKASDDFHERIKGLIVEAAEDLQQEIRRMPDEATGYNQYAWLIANTEGDYDKALEYSKKSLKLSPDNGGYYDTLARCYYAKQDYEKAVQVQAKAVELEPHSGQIQRQYELFEKKLAAHRKTAEDKPPAETKAEEPAEATGKKPPEKPAEKPSAKPAKKANEEPAEKPADDKKSDEPDTEPAAQKPAEESAREPADQSAEPPTEQNAGPEGTKP
jgi:tetratricopeptide (TPR) repeat protein